MLDLGAHAVIIHQGGHLIFASGTVAEGLGFEHPDAMIGMPLLELVHPDDRASVTAAVREQIETNQPRSPIERRLLRRDGSEVVYEIAGRPIVIDGEPAVVTIGRNVDEERAMLARMALADRLASIGGLAAGVAHGINNPLAYLLPNLTFALDEIGRIAAGGVDDETGVRLGELASALAQANDGATRIRDLVRDLVAFSGQDGGAPHPVELCAVVESALGLAQSLTRHRALVVRETEATPVVKADPARLIHVFVNLLQNATESLPEGDVEHHEIRIRISEHDGEASVEICDDGCGMSDPQLVRAFEPFFTTKPPAQGTGLGLPIARSIVRSLGGTIDVESQPGRGTRVQVRLPALRIREHLQLGIEGQGPLPVDQRARILIVDDEPAVLDVLERFLAPDFETETVTGGTDALARLASPPLPDLIVCDLLMPHTTGMDVYEAVSRTHPVLARRMLFLTGGAFTPRAAAFVAGMSGRVLDKPLERRVLLAAIAESLREA